jgi:hypothetical protein
MAKRIPWDPRVDPQKDHGYRHSKTRSERKTITDKSPETTGYQPISTGPQPALTSGGLSFMRHQHIALGDLDALLLDGLDDFIERQWQRQRLIMPEIDGDWAE